jgi:3-dehydroquinate dehydratase I
MKIVAALTDPSLAGLAVQQGADMIELRLDLIEGDVAGQVAACRETCRLPIIGTLRSAPEGGRFFGTPDEWIRKIRPILPFVDYVDIEQRFSSHAKEVRAAGKTVIASFHTAEMPPLFALFGIERDLRGYGDIVKIIATPQKEEDVIELIAFTHAVKMPVCTGVMGAEFRYARAVLALFGSELVYCHVGTDTAAGQYSVGEFTSLMKLLGKR